MDGKIASGVFIGVLLISFLIYWFIIRTKKGDSCEPSESEEDLYGNTYALNSNKKKQSL